MIQRIKEDTFIGAIKQEIYVSTVYDTVYKKYETMVFRKAVMEELDSNRTTRKADALKMHNHYVRYYKGIQENPKSTPKKRVENPYKQFAKDYYEVFEECKREFGTKRYIDGGTSNFDTPVLFSNKKVNIALFEEALLDLDLPYKLHGYAHGNREIHLQIPFPQYQGDMRTKQARFMSEKLKARGHEVSVYYQID